MTFFKNHVVLMFFYAIATGVFFAYLWKEEKRERIRLFVIIFVSLFIGGIALGWVMYPFPIK